MASLISSWWDRFWSFLGASWHLKKGTIIIVGCDNSGKTTLLHILRDNTLVAHEPTMHPRNEEVIVGGMKFNAHDMGGHAAARRLWRDYLGVSADKLGVVFVVDARDRMRFAEAATELQQLMSYADERTSAVPFLVLGNKIDADRFGNSPAVSEAELRLAMGIVEDDHPLHPAKLFMCSVVTRTGLTSSFNWLASMM